MIRCSAAKKKLTVQGDVAYASINSHWLYIFFFVSKKLYLYFVII